MKRLFVFAMFLWTGIMGVRAQKDHCDVNGDGVVNIADVTYVIDHVLGSGHASTPEAIDLGLPSRTKWASCNVGATKPEEYGGYYAWGEVSEKNYYAPHTYQFAYLNSTNGNLWDDDTQSYYSCTNLGSDISGTEHDVAHVKWGGYWCMPTLDDIMELIDNCTSEWTKLNGVNGRKFTSKKNGNSIFFPAAGYRFKGELRDANERGSYWSSTLDPSDSYSTQTLYFYEVHAVWGFNGRQFGINVRPVMKN